MRSYMEEAIARFKWWARFEQRRERIKFKNRESGDMPGASAKYLNMR